MNPLQFLKFALHGLWRQKVRTSLTLVGVSVGTCALAFSLSLGLGLRAFIDTEFQGRDDFWRVLVRVDEPPPDEASIPADKIAVKGAMSDDRRARIREALVDRYQNTRAPKAPKLLTPEKLDAISRLPDVAEVRTFRTGEGRVWSDTADKPAVAPAVSGALTDLQPRLLAGRLPESPDAAEVVVSEFALYQLGIADDADLPAAIGRTVRLEVGGVRNASPFALAKALLGGRPAEELTRGQTQALEKITRTLPQKVDQFDLSAAEKLEIQKLLQLPAEATGDERPLDSGKTVSGTYRVCGVVRIVTREERKKVTPLDSWELTSGHAFLPPRTGDALFGQLPWQKDGGFVTADVRVRPGGDLPGTVSAIEAMGFRTHSGAKWFAAAKREVTLIAAGLNLFAFIALFVAGVGITNTLVTSVIERTHEIGILRAVGATRGQIVTLFLLEGSLIGLLGAAFGLALAWGLALWADEWVRGLIAGQMDGQKMLSTTIFVFPAWLWAGSVLFAVGVTTLAALYPARRASRIHPIEALRYG
jgi:putative ABC transport system permease protein